MREVLSLQVGRSANFVGAHFWNFEDELAVYAGERGDLQDRYHPSVLFRVSQDRNRASGDDVIYTPRLLVFDTRDGLGGMHPKGTLQSPEAVDSSSIAQVWVGDVRKVYQEPHPVNAFQRFLTEDEQERGLEEGQGKWEGDEAPESEDNYEANPLLTTCHPYGLDESVTHWTDYTKCHIHSSTVQQLPFRDISPDFDAHAAGTADQTVSALGAEVMEDYVDALRKQLEECDAIQGVLTLGDMKGGWGGLTAQLLGELRDECRACPISCTALQASLRQHGSSSDRALAVVNAALSLYTLGQTSDLINLIGDPATVTPSGISPHLAVDAEKPYHTSALTAAALNMVTTPFRFQASHSTRAGSVAEWVRESCHGPFDCMKYATTTMSFPFADCAQGEEALRGLLVAPKALLQGDFERSGLPSYMGWLGPPAPGGAALTAEGCVKRFSQMLVTRGLNPPPLGQQAILKEAQSRLHCRSSSAAHPFATPLPMPLSYPLIFRDTLNEEGQKVCDPVLAPSSKQRMLCRSVGGLAAMECSSTLHPFLKEVAEGLQLTSPKIQVQLVKNGLHSDDVSE
ncbi:unnamed protein product, partial [Chrysoparadoxa australica]